MVGQGYLLKPIRKTLTRYSERKKMIKTRTFREALDKFMKSDVAGNARVQVVLPNGDFYDIKEIKLLENKLIGQAETHRLCITVHPEVWQMGKIKKKL